MGFIGNIGKVFSSIGNGIKSIAGPILKAVAPMATDLLKNIVGSGFDALKGAAGNFLNSLGLPSPLKDLAQKLLGKGADALKGLAGGGIEALIKRLVEQLTNRPVAGAPPGTTVTPPPIGGTPGAGTSGRTDGAAAAQAAFNQATGRPDGSGGSVEDRLLAGASALVEPKEPGANASELDLQKYQNALQKYSRMMDMYSKLMQAQHDMKKGIIANFRV